MVGRITFLSDRSILIDTGLELIVYRPATFFPRFAAHLIDVIIIFLPSIFIPLFPSWLYWSMLQSGPGQSTLGQDTLGIKTISIDGCKISFGQATGRFFGNLLNVFTLFIGYLMFFFNERNQCLHDYVSGCMVVQEVSRTGKPTVTNPL